MTHKTCNAIKIEKGVLPMLAFSLWKNLKKHLRRKRRPMWTLGGMLPILPLIGGLLLLPAQTEAAAGVADIRIEQPAGDDLQTYIGLDTAQEQQARQQLRTDRSEDKYGNERFGRQDLQTEEPNEKMRRELLASFEQSREPFTVKLHRMFVCGEELKPLGRITGSQLAGLLRSHPDWTVTKEEKPAAIIIEQQVDDLSEQCKANAYMGVDKAGRLSLYDGVPKKEKVVRTFFQLDVQYMESSLPQDKLDKLIQGIRISDMDEFNSVMSTYSDFAIEPNERVMKPQNE
jgi:forespore regulator of the sigma-K checkpoint